MDTNYNINKINELLNKLFSDLISDNKQSELNELLSSILHEKTSGLISAELTNYPKNILRLVVERNILLSMENKALQAGTTYLNVLKNSENKLNINILHHYFNTYIKDIKNNNLLYENKKSIEELRSIYNEEIKDNLKIMDKDIEKNLDNISSINLNHMENLNANGRTISINNNGVLSKKGGIFLDKKSKIGYGKFVNKNELIDIVRKTKKIDGIDMKSVGIRNLKMIMKSLTQTININSNEKIKNQDDRVISIGNKKAGSIFLGNKNINLPNGEYVSMEEITYAINKFLEEKKTIDKPVKVKKIKSKVKESIAVAALVATTLSATFTNVSASSVPETIVTEANDDDMSHNMDSINVNNIVNESKNETIFSNEQTVRNNVEKEIINNSEAIPVNNEKQIETPETNTEKNFKDVSNEVESEHENIIDKPKETIEEEILVGKENNSIEEQSKETVEEEILIGKENNPIEEQSKETVEEEILVGKENNPIEEQSKETVEEEMLIDNKEIDSTQTNKPIVEATNDNEISTEEKLQSIPEEKENIEDQSIEQENNNEQPIEKENVLVEPEEVESNIEETTDNGINGNDIVNYALQFVGNPYSYGGSSLTDGTDCSGFTSSVYSNFGVSLPRTSSEQRNSGENIGTDVANALPGDIICFDGHVGIYIGNGQMVHAANRRKGIVINDVDYDKPIKAIVRPNTTDIVKSNEEVPDESKTM